MTTSTAITPEVISGAMSYDEYRKLLDDEMANGRTTGTDQSEWLIDYARLNLQRIRRLDKTTVLVDDVRNALDTLQNPQLWVVLTEGWCGDAAQVVPVIAKIAEYSSKIGLKLLLRDEWPEVMDAYLTRGTRSIPKLIALKPQHLELIGSWGPRPEAAQQMVEEYKRNPKGKSKEDFTTMVHKWYSNNKTLDTQYELLACIREWDR